MCKFGITYSKKISQNARRSQYELEKKLKKLESKLNCETNFDEYRKCKKNLEFTKFFLILKKNKKKTKKKRSVKALVKN